ncbi:MAG TPA: porin family protein [Mucilaginibacter sp.]|jgi:hypothetical protein
MKKLLLSFCLTIGATITYAQTYGNGDNTITLGIAGGSSYAWFNVKAHEQSYVYTNAEPVFSIGFNADFKINDYFSIRPAVFYQGKGTELNVTADYVVEDKYHLHYFEIPVDFIGHWYLGDEGANIFYGGGPFFSFALNGTNQKTVYSDVTNEKITFGSNGDFKSTDYGVTTVLGYQTSQGFAISGNWEFGLVNILKNSDLNMGATSAKTGVFYLSMAQSF